MALDHCLFSVSSKNRLYSSVTEQLHKQVQKCTHMCTLQVPDLEVLLSRRGMNKTGVQRLSERRADARCACRCLCCGAGVFPWLPQCLAPDLREFGRRPLREYSHFYDKLSVEAQCRQKIHAHTHQYPSPGAFSNFFSLKLGQIGHF